MVHRRSLSPDPFSMICVDNRIIEAFCGCSAQSLSGLSCSFSSGKKMTE